MIKQHLQSAVQGLFETLWSAVFRVAGRRFTAPRHVLSPGDGLTPGDGLSPGDGEGPRRILVVAPHPDDEAAGCAGTLLAHHAAGDRVTVACVTDGRRSRAHGLGPAEMAARRRQEAERAARMLGADLEWLGLPEGEWQLDEATGRLRELLAELLPSLVYAPSRIDFHPEHERVARALAAALDGEAATPLVRIYPVQVPLTPILADVLVPVANLRDVELAFSCYETQLGTLRRCLRMRRYAACLAGHRAPVEEFWQMNAARYVRLHREPPARPVAEVFRGLRYYAWSDPLSYLRGRRERRRLAARR